MSEQKKVINALYHSGIDTLLSAGFIMLGKKFLKFKTPNPTEFSVGDMGLITVCISSGRRPYSRISRGKGMVTTKSKRINRMA